MEMSVPHIPARMVFTLTQRGPGSGWSGSSPYRTGEIGVKQIDGNTLDKALVARIFGILTSKYMDFIRIIFNQESSERLFP
jgi:hypothetical protein